VTYTTLTLLTYHAINTLILWAHVPEVEHGDTTLRDCTASYSGDTHTLYSEHRNNRDCVIARFMSWREALDKAFSPVSVLRGVDSEESNIISAKHVNTRSFALSKENVKSCQSCASLLPSLQSLIRSANLVPVSRIKEASSHGRVVLCQPRGEGDETSRNGTAALNAVVAMKVMPLVRDDLWLSLFDDTLDHDKKDQALASAQAFIRSPYNSAFMEPAIMKCLSESACCPYVPKFYGAAIACADRRDELMKNRKATRHVSPTILRCAQNSTPVVVCAMEATLSKNAHDLIEAQKMAERHGGRPLAFIPFLCHAVAALDALHRMGVVHNDVHLSNLMVRKTNDKSCKYACSDGKILVIPNPNGEQLVLIDFGRAADHKRRYITSEIERFNTWDVSRSAVDVSLLLCNLLRHWAFASNVAVFHSVALSLD